MGVITIEVLLQELLVSLRVRTSSVKCFLLSYILPVSTFIGRGKETRKEVYNLRGLRCSPDGGCELAPDPAQQVVCVCVYVCVCGCVWRDSRVHCSLDR